MLQPAGDHRPVRDGSRGHPDGAGTRRGCRGRPRGPPGDDVYLVGKPREAVSRLERLEGPLSPADALSPAGRLVLLQLARYRLIFNPVSV